jgi:hypothetical protein
MKKNLSAVAISVFVLALPWSVSAQMNQLPTFNLQFSFGNGSSVINNGGINTRLHTTSTEILGIYQINENLGFGSGISLMGHNGNGFNDRGNFNQTRGIVRVPFLLNTNKYLLDKTALIASGGVFVNHIIEDTYRYIGSTEEFQFDNWSMGAQARLGISYDIYSNTAIGFVQNIQYNFLELSQSQSTIDTEMSSNTFDLFVKLRF